MNGHLRIHVVGLFGYLVEGLHDEGVAVNVSLATALFVPVAVGAIWWIVRRATLQSLHAATTLIRAAARERGFARMTISMS